MSRIQVHPVTRSLLTTSDLTWSGMAKFPSYTTGDPLTGYSSAAPGVCAVRYVGEERRIITMLRRTVTPPNYQGNVGNLVEWSEPALYTGSDPTLANSMVKTNEWTAWHAGDGVGGQWSTLDLESGVYVGGLLWDETNHGVWYVCWAYYEDIGYPWLGFTVLNDNGTVGDKKGMWFYWDDATDDTNPYWHAVGSGIVSIPAYAQALLGNRTVGFVGMPIGTIGGEGHMGPGFRAFSALPPLTDAPGTVIPDGLHLMDYTRNNCGETPQNCHRSNTSYTQIGCIHSFSTIFLYDASENSYSADQSNKLAWGAGGLALLADEGDILYLCVGSDAAEKPGNIYLEMSTPAVGGAREWRYYKNGVGFSALTATYNPGAALLSGEANNGYWSIPADMATTTINGVAGYWIAIVTTSAHSTAGNLSKSGYTNYTAPNNLANPAPSGAVGYWHQSADNAATWVWIDTGEKHGILVFARQCTGNLWYGATKGYSGATLIEDTRNPSAGGYGYHAQTYNPCLYVFDPNHLFEVAAGTRSAGPSGMVPAAEYDWNEAWPNIPDTAVDHPWVTSYQGNAGFYDAAAGELLWVTDKTYVDGSGPTYNQTLQVFAVS